MTKKPQDKVEPDSSSKEDKEGEGSGDFGVVDRRFWVKKDWNPEDRSESRLPTVLQELESKVKEKEQKIQEVRDAAVAVRQESESYRQRLQRDLDRKVDNSKAFIMAELVELADNLERSVLASKQAAADLDATPESSGKALEQLHSLIKGLEMICALFHDKLAKQGVKKLEVLNKPYNPETAEALDLEKTEDPAKHDLVIKVFQDGYGLNGRTIRAARVSIAKYEENPDKKVKEEKDA